MNFPKALIRNAWDEYALCLLFKRRRMRLPQLALNAWFAEVDDVPVSVSALPKGAWSSPLADLVYLLKLVSLLKPSRILELGSYRGYVARAIAEHMPPDAQLVAVDIDADHGEAYRDSAFAARIERRVGAIGADLFAEHERGSYDLVFVDADHQFSSVKHDTEVTLPLLSPSGVMVWHDYANWGAFSGMCGVPEYLAELSTALPVAHLAGSRMAVYNAAWSGDGHAEFEEMLKTTRNWQDDGHWQSGFPSG